MVAIGIDRHDAGMTFPPPTLPAAPVSISPPSPHESELSRLLRSVSPATWVALLGGALVLIASAIVTASNWATIGLVVRAAALSIITAGLTGAALRLRALAPTTAGVIAHIGCFLVAPTGMAALSALGFTWPT